MSIKDMYTKLGASGKCYLCNTASVSCTYIPRTADVKIKGKHGEMVRFEVCNKCYARCDKQRSLSSDQLRGYSQVLDCREVPGRRMTRAERRITSNIINPSPVMIEEDRLVPEEPTQSFDYSNGFPWDADDQEDTKFGRPPEGEVPSAPLIAPEDRGLSEKGQDSSSLVYTPRTKLPEVRWKDFDGNPVTPAEGIMESSSPPPRECTFEEFLELFSQTGELQAWLKGAEILEMKTMEARQNPHVTVEELTLKIFLL